MATADEAGGATEFIKRQKEVSRRIRDYVVGALILTGFVVGFPVAITVQTDSDVGVLDTLLGALLPEAIVIGGFATLGALTIAAFVATWQQRRAAGMTGENGPPTPRLAADLATLAKLPHVTGFGAAFLASNVALRQGLTIFADDSAVPNLGIVIFVLLLASLICTFSALAAENVGTQWENEAERNRSEAMWIRHDHEARNACYDDVSAGSEWGALEGIGLRAVWTADIAAIGGVVVGIVGAVRGSATGEEVGLSFLRFSAWGAVAGGMAAIIVYGAIYWRATKEILVAVATLAFTMFWLVVCLGPPVASALGGAGWVFVVFSVAGSVGPLIFFAVVTLPKERLPAWLRKIGLRPVASAELLRLRDLRRKPEDTGYLLRTVAAGDGDRSLSIPLTRYYTEEGTPVEA